MPRVALKVVASPVRQEMLAALGHGPIGARALADSLGRSPQALYYHLRMLQRAGWVRCAGWRGAGRQRERLYALARTRLVAAATAHSPSQLRTVARATSAMLRLTARELQEALRGGCAAAATPPARLMAARGKARLTDSELRRLHRLLAQAESLLRRAKRRRTGPPLVSLTLVLTPSRVARGNPS